MKRALIVRGGWDGHEPVKVSELLGGLLRENGFEVEISDTLDSFNDADALKRLSLIVPIWSMGRILPEQEKAVLSAVESGVGIGGCHGGMCDSFRESVGWQFLTGGQWVAHPGNDGVEYVVNVRSASSPITQGIGDFPVKSEQYYMHVDPAVEVLATTRFPIAPGPYASNGQVDMPVVWTKRWGRGRVFFSSLGHHADVIDHGPALEIVRRGLIWASAEDP